MVIPQAVFGCLRSWEFIGGYSYAERTIWSSVISPRQHTVRKGLTLLHLCNVVYHHADIILSGLLLAFVWLAPQYCNISEVFIPDARRLASLG